jgi:hypothetical protein
MSRRRNITMLKTPDGIFNTLNAHGVTSTDTGVAIVNENDSLICWIEVQDPDIRSKVSLEISERVYQAQLGDNVEPIDWDKFGIFNKGGTDKK